MESPCATCSVHKCDPSIVGNLLFLGLANILKCEQATSLTSLVASLTCGAVAFCVFRVCVPRVIVFFIFKLHKD